MLHLPENLRKHRLSKNLTQEDVARYLNITPQSVSKWERGESYPDVTLLPALANIFETSIDLLMGMDAIRAEDALRSIHQRAVECQRSGDWAGAEGIYRDALRIYPNNPGMTLGLAATLALKGDTAEAVSLIELGLPASANEKQKATLRAVLCFLYLKAGRADQADRLASQLPHMRECREAILPVIREAPPAETIDAHIRRILLGDEFA